MTTYSVQYAAGIAKLLGAFLSLIGVVIPEGDLVTFVGVFVGVASALIGLYDRHMKGNITITGKRI